MKILKVILDVVLLGIVAFAMIAVWSWSLKGYLRGQLLSSKSNG